MSIKPSSPWSTETEREEMNDFRRMIAPRLSADVFKRLFLKHMRKDASVNWLAMRRDADHHLQYDMSLSEDDIDDENNADDVPFMMTSKIII